MKEILSSFDRFTMAFATGCLFLLGVYLVVSAAVPSYDTLKSFMTGEPTGLIFGVPLVVLSYLVGVINVTVGTLIYERIYGSISDEYCILDWVEARSRPVVLKEISDLMGAQRLMLGSPAGLLLIAVGLIGMNVLPFHDVRFPGYRVPSAVGALVLVALALSCFYLSKLVHDQLRSIQRSLKKTSEDSKI